MICVPDPDGRLQRRPRRRRQVRGGSQSASAQEHAQVRPRPEPEDSRLGNHSKFELLTGLSEQADYIHFVGKWS